MLKYNIKEDIKPSEDLRKFIPYCKHALAKSINIILIVTSSVASSTTKN